MSRAVSLCTVTDAAFPLEIALQSPGVSDAALAAGPSSVTCSHSFLDSLRWLSNRTAWLFPFCLTRYCLSRHVPAGPPPEVTVIPLLLLAGACGLRSVKQDGDAPGGLALIVCCRLGKQFSICYSRYLFALPTWLMLCGFGDPGDLDFCHLIIEA